MSDDTPDPLQAIWEQSRDSTIARITLIDDAVAAAAAGTLEPDRRRDAARAAHMLAGSVGTFGFTAATEHARTLEHALEGEEPLDAAASTALAGSAAALRRELAGPPRTAWTPEQAAEIPAAAPEILLTGDPVLVRELAAELCARGLRAEASASLTAARDAVRAAVPDLIVLDLGAPEGVGTALDVLVDTALRCPVAVLTDPGLLVDRVEVARRGGRALLPRSANVLDLAEQLVALHRRLRPRDTTVLAVDDDPALLEALRVVLAGAGLRVEGCTEPGLFWERLEALRPDLVVLDVDMPHISGLELCRAIRADRAWEGLPVMVLTARTDEDTVVEVFRAGADDFVAKPVVGPELLARIGGRLERIRLYRALAETDPLTGLANRRRSYESLEELRSAAARIDEPLSLAVVDLDGFKGLNDTLGHAAGDAALRAVAGSLGRTFTAGESVARWGGDEFVIGLPGLSATDARERIGAFLEDLRGQELGGQRAGERRLTASAGVAEYPRDGYDLDALHHAADAALYVAKSAGGDRVHDAGAAHQGDPEEVDVILVEDDELLCEVVEGALHTRGYTTRRISDGLEAAASLAAITPEVVAPVILLDWDLPSVDGLRILEVMADNGTLRRSRVIMMTARSSQAEVEQALAAGASEHVAKPFAVSALMDSVRRVVVRPH